LIQTRRLLQYRARKDTQIPNEEIEMRNFFVRLWKEDEGQDLTEYALLLVLLSLAAIGALGTLATAINNVFSTAATNLSTT
jgi:pilus assembly protein Flp/PilA